MIIYLALFLLLCLWGVKFSGFREDYISKDQSGAFKGIFAMLIFLSHISPYTNIQSSTNIFDRVYWGIFSTLGQMVVVVFLFYSGYGIMESIKNKPGYMKGFFRNRILKLFIDYNIVTLVYAVYRTCTGAFFTWDHYLFSLVGWRSLAHLSGRGNWFVFGILLLYCITLLLSMLLTKVFRLEGKKYRYCLMASVMAANVILVAVLQYSGLPKYWFNTLFVYSFGMLYAIFRGTIEKAMRKTKWYIAALAAVCAGIVVIVAFNLNHLVFYSLMACLFASFIVLISMYVRIQNPVLIWLGKLCFSIYIVHNGVMGLFRNLGLASNEILYGGICIAVSLVLAQLHYFLSGKLTGALLKREKIHK